MRYTVRPISDRTAFTGKHKRAPFKSTWTDTEQLLAHELHMIGGRDVVIECDVSDRDIRIDGQLYARARPASPAVRVAFDSRHGPLTYATDRFDHWQDNVRAIALGLEGLRRVDRYGISQRGEQYQGYKAIEATPASSMTRDAAMATLVKFGRPSNGTSIPEAVRTIGDRQQAARYVKRAKANCHPDRHGGDQALWDQLATALRVLGLEAA